MKNKQQLTAVEEANPKLYTALDAYSDYSKPEELMEVRPILVGFIIQNQKMAIDGLMKLLQVFSSFEDMIDVQDFANDIQRYLFGWTEAHSEALNTYLKSIEAEPVQTVSPLAKQLSAIMQNPDTPPQVECAIGQLLCELHSEGEGVENKEYTPEYVEVLLNANKKEIRLRAA